MMSRVEKQLSCNSNRPRSYLAQISRVPNLRPVMRDHLNNDSVTCLRTGPRPNINMNVVNCCARVFAIDALAGGSIRMPCTSRLCANQKRHDANAIALADLVAISYLVDSLEHLSIWNSRVSLANWNTYPLCIFLHCD